MVFVVTVQQRILIFDSLSRLCSTTLTDGVCIRYGMKGENFYVVKKKKTHRKENQAMVDVP